MKCLLAKDRHKVHKEQQRADLAMSLQLFAHSLGQCHVFSLVENEKLIFNKYPADSRK
jgi:hypothetical protein